MGFGQKPVGNKGQKYEEVPPRIASPLRRRAVVIGGGFVGICSAINLANRGYAVTVLEKSAVGIADAHNAASYGNAGTFAPYATFGLNADRPGIVLNVMGALFRGADEHISPLNFAATLGNLSEIFTFGLYFWRASSAENSRKSSEALAELCKRASFGWQRTLENAGMPNSFFQECTNRNGYLLLTKSKFNSASIINNKLERDELLEVRSGRWGDEAKSELLSPQQCLELEPNLTEFAVENGGIFFKYSWQLRDPGYFLKSLAGFATRRFSDTRSSGTIDIKSGDSGNVIGIRSSVQDKTVAEIVTQNGDVYQQVDEIVVCAGWQSKEIAIMCGDGNIPLIAERGYGIEFTDDASKDTLKPFSQLLTRATCFQRGGFILSPMQNRLRIAGLVEFGPGQPPSPENFNSLETLSKKILKFLRQDEPCRDPCSDWLGSRPTLPDYLPVISRSQKKKNVIYAFGHQHIGFTLAGITAELVGKLASREMLEFSMQPYGVGRFDQTCAPFVHILRKIWI